jgi:hypothetical protein
VVKNLLCKCKVLSSNLSPQKRKKKKGREEGKEEKRMGKKESAGIK